MIVIAALAAVSILMVVAMVQYTTALIDAEAAPALRRMWGAAYLLAWLGVVGVVVLIVLDAHTAWPRALAVAALVAGGWGGFHAFWLWLWLALTQSNAAKSGTPGPSVAALALARRCRRIATAAVVVVVLALIELGVARAALAAVTAPGRAPLSLTIAIAAAGGALLIGGGVRLALDRGRPMTAEEIDEAFRRQKYGPRGRTGLLRASASVYRHVGPAAGATADQVVSLSEMKAAWRSGAWRRDRRWQTVFMMTAGGLMMIYGGFGAAVVAGPLSAKLLCGGALAYATFQLIAGFRRA